jgi:hypothetical protein
MDVEAYRGGVERFIGELEREYVLHLSGRKTTLDLEPIYDRHSALFDRAAVDELVAGGPRELARFAAEGHVGRATKAEAAEIARREATLTVELDGGEMAFRRARVEQANEPDPERRAELEAAILRVTDAELNPLHLEAHERTAALACELGFASTLDMCERLGGIDLRALARQCEELLSASDPWYEEQLGPQLVAELGFGLDELRRSDVAAFMRAPRFDPAFPADDLLRSYDHTLAGLGLGNDGIELDLEERASKSPRAFCAPVRVPDEVHLVMARYGGREDYVVLFHEAGHAHHYSRVDARLPVEARYLGDNSVTEGFAFLFEELVGTPEWLDRVLGVSDSRAIVRHTRAVRLYFLRRYCAKLLYELELHGGELDPPSRGAGGRAPRRYAELLSRAVGVDWPATTWLVDVDAFFYAARYLRAWALETYLRRTLRDRFAAAWFAEPEAGALLRALWSGGQAHDADELLDELTGERLELAAVARDLAPA